MKPNSLPPGTIKMHVVQSSNIAAIGHDDESNELHVQFLSGTSYKYFDVDEKLFQQMLDAPSVGRFLNDEIKPRHDCVKC